MLVTWYFIHKFIDEKLSSAIVVRNVVLEEKKDNIYYRFSILRIEGSLSSELCAHEFYPKTRLTKHSSIEG